MPALGISICTAIFVMSNAGMVLFTAFLVGCMDEHETLTIYNTGKDVIDTEMKKEWLIDSKIPIGIEIELQKAPFFAICCAF